MKPSFKYIHPENIALTITNLFNNIRPTIYRYIKFIITSIDLTKISDHSNQEIDELSSHDEKKGT